MPSNNKQLNGYTKPILPVKIKISFNGSKLKKELYN